MTEKVKKILADYTGMPEDEIKPDADLATDLNLSSLDVVNLIVAVEDELGVEISDRAIRDLKTVKDIVDCISANK